MPVNVVGEKQPAGPKEDIRPKIIEIVRVYAAQEFVIYIILQIEWYELKPQHDIKGKNLFDAVTTKW